MGANRQSQHQQPELTPVNRVVAALLAIIWLSGGLAALLLGLAKQNWFELAIGLLTLGYGILWVRVAWTRRWLRWPGRRR